MANLYETMNVGTDGLVYDMNPATEAFFVTIKANAGALKRGTVLAVGSDNKMVVLGSGTGTANCVLCDDIEVGSADVKAVAYRAGHFAVEKLHVAAGYTMTDADKTALRDAGILVSNAVEL
jgi:hypothetical protein